MGSCVTNPDATGIPVAGGGNYVKTVFEHDGEVATGVTTIPLDDSIPQNTEGNEYLTKSITPDNSANKLIIMVKVILSHSTTGGHMGLALFQDSIADSLKSSSQFYNIDSSAFEMSIVHVMTAGTTSPVVFKVRAGSNNAGTTTFNGRAAARLDGGTLDSSITILEVAA